MGEGLGKNLVHEGFIIFDRPKDKHKKVAKKEMSVPHVIINLSKEEAIVLFEFVSRLNKNLPAGYFHDQSEQRVLWDIEAILEKSLEEPLLPNYTSILNKARERVRDD